MLFRGGDNIAIACQADITVTDPISRSVLQSALQKLTKKAAQSSQAYVQSVTLAKLWYNSGHKVSVFANKNQVSFA